MTPSPPHSSHASIHGISFRFVINHDDEFVAPSIDYSRMGRERWEESVLLVRNQSNAGSFVSVYFFINLAQLPFQFADVIVLVNGDGLTATLTPSVLDHALSLYDFTNQFVLSTLEFGVFVCGH